MGIAKEANVRNEYHEKRDVAFYNSKKTSNPQLRLLRLNGLGFDQISYADVGN